MDPDDHDAYSYSLVSRSSSSNIRLWLDANDSNSILQKDGKVYEWRDLSGRGNHAKQPESTHQPTLVEDRIQFDGNDILQVRDDALRHSSPGIIVVAKWDASVTWGNTIAGYHGESSVGWKLRQYDSSINRITFTSRGTTGTDNPNPSKVTSQSEYFICSSFREDDFRYLRHNGSEISKVTDAHHILIFMR